MKASEGRLEFPCELRIKIVGRCADDFESHATALVKAHSESVVALPSRARVSKGGKYSAITLRVQLASRESMTALYAELTNDERVLWAI